MLLLITPKNNLCNINDPYVSLMIHLNTEILKRILLLKISIC